MEKKTRRWNYKLYTAINAIGAFVGGLFGPFYLIFLQKIGGGVETFGMLLGIMMLAESLTSIFAGKYSDKFGRKPLLIGVGYVGAIIVTLYTLITQIWQLYILQILMGISNAIGNVAHSAFMGDITEKTTRGHHIGKFYAITGMLGALAMMISGVIVGRFGFKAIFYLTALTTVATTTFLFKIKE